MGKIKILIDGLDLASYWKFEQDIEKDEFYQITDSAGGSVVLQCTKVPYRGVDTKERYYENMYDEIGKYRHPSLYINTGTIDNPEIYRQHRKFDQLPSFNHERTRRYNFKVVMSNIECNPSINVQDDFVIVFYDDYIACMVRGKHTSQYNWYGSAPVYTVIGFVNITNRSFRVGGDCMDYSLGKNTQCAFLASEFTKNNIKKM